MMRLSVLLSCARVLGGGGLGMLCLLLLGV